MESCKSARVMMLIFISAAVDPQGRDCILEMHPLDDNNPSQLPRSIFGPTYQIGEPVENVYYKMSSLQRLKKTNCINRMNQWDGLSGLQNWNVLMMGQIIQNNGQS
jgi:hypothetical protein